MLSHSISRPRYSPRMFSFSLRLLNSWYTEYVYAPFLGPWPRDNESDYGSKPGELEQADDSYNILLFQQ